MKSLPELSEARQIDYHQQRRTTTPIIPEVFCFLKSQTYILCIKYIKCIIRIVLPYVSRPCDSRGAPQKIKPRIIKTTDLMCPMINSPSSPDGNVNLRCAHGSNGFFKLMNTPVLAIRKKKRQTQPKVLLSPCIHNNTLLLQDVATKFCPCGNILTAEQ